MRVKRERYTVCVDFDGVLHSYVTPWVAAHVIPDPPVEGAIEWLFSTIQHFDVAVFSTRGKTLRGRRAMRDWIKEHAGNLWYPAPAHLGIEEIRFVREKVPALVYIDDRAYRFEGPGSFPSQNEIHQLRPWYR